MRIKDFNKELFFFLDKIKRNEHFSLSRWGDGELMILEGQSIDLRNVKNGEFRYDSKLNQYKRVRDILKESFTYNSPNYFVGIACPCCVGKEKFLYMKETSKQNEDNLTWANIFVNSNYKTFLENFFEEFKRHEVAMVVNHQAKPENLTFNISEVYFVGTDAWYEDYNLIEKIKQDIKINSIKDRIYLIAAGPLANLMTYELWKENKNNTYIDIGSVFDTQMGMKATRGYQMGASTLTKKCIW